MLLKLLETDIGRCALLSDDSIFVTSQFQRHGRYASCFYDMQVTRGTKYSERRSRAGLPVSLRLKYGSQSAVAL
eukprot:4239660-Amphidinium_carterae.1